MCKADKHHIPITRLSHRKEHIGLGVFVTFWAVQPARRVIVKGRTPLSSASSHMKMPKHVLATVNSLYFLF